MGRGAAVALACSALISTACGDPLVVIGDAPDVLRIVAGVPDSAGFEISGSGLGTLLNRPQGLAVGPDGTLYITDTDNARILAVESNGRIRVVIDHRTRAEEPRLRRPTGLALQGSTALIVADPAAERVWRVTLESGGLTPVAGTGSRGIAPDTVPDATTADLDTPTGVATAPDGVVYFTETNAHRVRRVEPNGTLITVAGIGLGGFSGDGGPGRQARLLRPSGLDLGDGTLYIADTGNQRIRQLDLAGDTIRTIVGTGVRTFGGDGGPATEATLNGPTAVAISDDGSDLFIADTGNQRVRVVNLGRATITTLAGTGDETFNGDLLEAGATALSQPAGLTISSLGLLFIADTGHQIVRRTAVRFITGS